MTTQPEAQLLHHQISKELGTEIIDGLWAAHTARRLEDLQTRFTVSRTVAREVSRQLESMGLVQSRRGLGLVARPMTEWRMLDPELILWRLNSTHHLQQLHSLTQLRLVVEPLAAELTAAVAPIHTRVKLLPLAKKLCIAGEAGDRDEFMKLDIEFHRLLFESSGNELVAALSPLIVVVLQSRAGLGGLPLNLTPSALAAHMAIAEAVFNGDGDGARDAMQIIIDEVRAALRDPQPAH